MTGAPDSAELLRIRARYCRELAATMLTVSSQRDLERRAAEYEAEALRQTVSGKP